MARYKPYDLNQSKMIPLSYADQIVEGSFEHALNELAEEHKGMISSRALAEACRRNVVFMALSADSGLTLRRWRRSSASSTASSWSCSGTCCCMRRSWGS
jgi:hypothetical protein